MRHFKTNRHPLVTSHQLQRPSQAPPQGPDLKLPLNLSGDPGSGVSSRSKEINIVPVTGDSVKVIASFYLFETFVYL